MEGFFDALGALSLSLLVLIGLLAGFIAGKLMGRSTVLYMVFGVIGAVALPFLLAALGLGLVAAGGLLVLLVIAAIGAMILIAVCRMIFGEGRR